MAFGSPGYVFFSAGAVRTVHGFANFLALKKAPGPPKNALPPLGPEKKSKNPEEGARKQEQPEQERPKNAKKH